MKSRLFVPVLWALAAAALFGASTPACKLLVGRMGTFELAGLLYLGAALGTAPAALRSSWKTARAAHGRRRLLLSTLFGGLLGPLFLLAALDRAPAAAVALWLALESVATAVVGRMLFHERLGRSGWGAVAVVTAGATVLAAPSGVALGTAATLAALACLCWGVDNNVASVIDSFTPAQIAFVKGLGAGTVNLAIGRALADHPIDLSASASALGIGALGYGASLALYVASAQQLGPSRSQLVFSTSPLWGAAGSALIASERLQPLHGAAAGLMVAGMWLLYRDRHEHEHSHAALAHSHAHRHDDGHHTHAHPDLPASTWHSHEHTHHEQRHAHPHVSDLHHRHEH
jgi:drug/metabolite transporter (DMT)-like permease